MIYLDTSALIKLYLKEQGSTEVQELVAGQDDPLPVWELQEAELTNALRLKVHWGELGCGDADAQVALFRQRKARGHYYFPDLDRVELMGAFHELSQLTPETGCRTLDILHVACALQLGPEVFGSYDSRQRVLAGRAGLTLFPSPHP